MQNLMSFEIVSELMELDARNEKRDRILFGAVNETVLCALRRNILLDTITEQIETIEGKFELREYPIREIIEMKDTVTGETVLLDPSCSLKDIRRPDAHQQMTLKISGTKDRQLTTTYRYGYLLEEVPLLIQSKIIDIMRERLENYGKLPSDVQDHIDKDHLGELSPYMRKFAVWG